MTALRRSITIALALALLLSVGVLLTACKKEVPTPKPAPKPAPVEPEPPRYYWPLTGLEAPDEPATLNRPISVKIENSQAARPQVGLNSADIVYETMVEGGLTRFNALFMSSFPEELGPVRSARLSDIWIVPQYDALFYYSGGNPQVSGRIKDKGIEKFDENNAKAQFFRLKSRKAPHNLFLKTAEIEPAVQNAGFRRVVQDTPHGLEFGELSSLETTLTGANVKVKISNYANPTWDFDSSARVYLRSEGSTPLNDERTGEQIRATNVVVMWATYTRQATKDSVNNNTFDTTLGGTGRVMIFKDGQVIEGTWEATETSPPRFRDLQGKSITLNPGNTWFEVIPTDRNVEVSARAS